MARRWTLPGSWSRAGLGLLALGLAGCTTAGLALLSEVLAPDDPGSGSRAGVQRCVWLGGHIGDAVHLTTLTATGGLDIRHCLEVEHP